MLPLFMFSAGDEIVGDLVRLVVSFVPVRWGDGERRSITGGLSA